MKRYVLGMLILASLFVLLSGCGKSTESSSSSTKEEQEQEVEEEQKVAEESYEDKSKRQLLQEWEFEAFLFDTNGEPDSATAEEVMEVDGYVPTFKAYDDGTYELGGLLGEDDILKGTWNIVDEKTVKGKDFAYGYILEQDEVDLDPPLYFTVIVSNEYVDAFGDATRISLIMRSDVSMIYVFDRVMK